MCYVSVIVPTLNEQDNIERCLKSIIFQEVRESYEIIVSDGGSKDGTRSIAEKYADRVILSGEKGASVQRNVGAKTSRGKILVFIDADSIMPRNYLREVVKAMRPRDIVGGTTFLSAKLNGETAFQRAFFRFYYNYMNLMQFICNFVGFPGGFGTSVFVRRSSFWLVNGFRRTLNAYSDDTDFFRRLKREGKLILLRNIKVPTSPRRFTSQGIIRTILFYLKRDIATITLIKT